MGRGQVCMSMQTFEFDLNSFCSRFENKDLQKMIKNILGLGQMYLSGPLKQNL